MFTTIIVGLKFSDAGISALQCAADFAREQKAHLHIFHALDYHFAETSSDDSELRQAQKQADEKFEKLVKDFLSGVSYAFEKRPADPGLEVCRLAMEKHADLIVLGCHQVGKKAARARVDYTAMTVFDKSPCKILLVPYH